MNIHEEDYPYSIYKRPEGDELLDAHNDIIAVFDPHTEPEIERMVAAAPEMYELLLAVAANPTTNYSSKIADLLWRIKGDEDEEETP